MLKRISAIVISLLMIFGIAACGKGEYNEKRTLSVWVLSEDYADYIEWAVKNCCDDIDWQAEISVVDSASIEQLIEDSVCKGNIPDIIMLPPEKVETLAKNGILMPFSSLGISIDESRYYGFAVNTGKSDGKLYAMCWHASPGLFAYRRTIANAYLGTDDPVDIANLITDDESFLDVSQLLKAASLNETHILAGISDITRAYWSGDFKSLDEASVAEYFEFVKKLADEGYVYDAEQWSEAWIEGFNDSRSVFGYFLSGIAVDDVLCEVSSESRGDWAVTVPYSGYAWGGAYLSVYSGSDNASDAAELIRTLTVNESAMKKLSLYSGIFTANRNVNDAVASDTKFELSVLGGQNYFKVLISSAEQINSENIQSSNDSVIISLLNACAVNYISGEYELSAATEIFFNSLESFTS